jgi:hypothetical protein
MTMPSTGPTSGSGSGIPAGPAGMPAAPSDNTGTSGVRNPDGARPTVTVAAFADYESAQRAVDYLSDNQFPVEHTAIIGTDLVLVETVLGRMTTGRAALAGAGSGAWFGLLIGLLLSIFSVSAWWALLLTGLLIGTLWGAAFGAIAHALTRGQRDFSSRSQLRASQYAVTVDSEYADQARQLVVRLNWQVSNGPHG